MNVAEQNGVAWMDGEFVPFGDARVHILTHTLHYGLGVFEGTRAYRQAAGGTAVFRLDDHLSRLRRSSHMLQLPLPFDEVELRAATLELVARNGLESGYIRHLVYLGHASMGLLPRDNPVRVAITTWPWGAYLGEEGMARGIRCKISSHQRAYPNSALTKAKATGAYIASILAKREAVALGFDEALMLDTEGFVAEASGANLFIVSGGRLVTPPACSILEGITRDTMMRLARDEGLEVREGRIPRDDLYVADEAFLTGTAAEVTPIREVDGRVIGAGDKGPITGHLQDEFFRAVRGELAELAEWLAPVRGAETSAAADA
jgi:branched-chain amino acid aminotransferase